MPTYTPKAGDTTRSWYVIDATDVVLGRLAVEAAKLLRGKHKPTFTPNVDGGDFVIVINADKVKGCRAVSWSVARRATVRDDEGQEGAVGHPDRMTVRDPPVRPAADREDLQ